MAESTLALTFDNLMALTAERAGYGYRANAAAGLSADEETEIDLYVQEGYRDFLKSYEWSFMRPTTTSVFWGSTVATLTMTVSGAGNTTITADSGTPFFPTMIGHSIVSTNGSYVISGYTSSSVVTVTTDASADTGLAFQVVADGSYRLPDDFGGLVGDVYFNAAEGYWSPLANTGVAELIHALQGSTGTGRPTMVAVESVAVSGTIGQRSDALVWRVPDTDYTVRYQYTVLPDALVTTAYPYGGQHHAETIKYAALAALERSKYQISSGPWAKQYAKLLQDSIRSDQRNNRADTVGLMVRRSRRRGIRPQATNVTYDGTRYPT